MATGTNGIVTEGEAKSKLGYSGSVDTNKGCTKSRAIAMGADSSILGSYSDNQLVKYSSISKLMINWDYEYHIEIYNVPTYVGTYLTLEGKDQINNYYFTATATTSGIMYTFTFNEVLQSTNTVNGNLNFNISNIYGSGRTIKSLYNVKSGWRWDTTGMSESLATSYGTKNIPFTLNMSGVSNEKGKFSIYLKGQCGSTT